MDAKLLHFDLSYPWMCHVKLGLFGSSSLTRILKMCFLTTKLLRTRVHNASLQYTTLEPLPFSSSNTVFHISSLEKGGLLFGLLPLKHLFRVDKLI